MPKYQRNNSETMPSGMSRSAGVAGPNRLENPKVGRGIALRGGMVPARNRGDADLQTQLPGQIAQLRLGGAHPDHPVVPGHLGAEIDDARAGTEIGGHGPDVHPADDAVLVL